MILAIIVLGAIIAAAIIIPEIGHKAEIVPQINPQATGRYGRYLTRQPPTLDIQA